jgi:hypothetical protein
VLAVADYDAVPRKPVDLTGFWILNTAASDDPEALLAQKQDKEWERFERMRRRAEDSRPANVPPPIDVDATPPGDSGRRRGPRPWQKRHQENLLQMLGVSPTLEIKQIDPVRFDVISAVDSRRVEAGSHTQVSMPEGELADSWVGWDGEWFVIERRVRKGPRALEQFRLTKTGQLEYLMKWSGETELAGIKVRRFYDRRTGPAPESNPDHGPSP